METKPAFNIWSLDDCLTSQAHKLGLAPVTLARARETLQALNISVAPVFVITGQAADESDLKQALPQTPSDLKYLFFSYDLSQKALPVNQRSATISTTTQDQLGQAVVALGAGLMGEVISLEPQNGLRSMSLVIDSNGHQAVVFTHGVLTDKPSIIDRQAELDLTDQQIQILVKLAGTLEGTLGQPVAVRWFWPAKADRPIIFWLELIDPACCLIDLTHLEYNLTGSAEAIVTGEAIGHQIVTGIARHLNSPEEAVDLTKEDILIVPTMSPVWEPLMRQIGGLVSEQGSRLAHAAILGREMGLACIVGASDAKKHLTEGATITLDCSHSLIGRVYRGAISFTTKEHSLKEAPTTKTQMLLNISCPDDARRYAALPVAGVGLARQEFVIAGEIGIHPCALLAYPNVSSELKDKIARLLPPELSEPRTWYIDKLATGMGLMAAAFWPRPVLIRFSDFKSNEYRNLLGGADYEPAEDNPMLGWRGASRYYHPDFQAAFTCEVQAVQKVIVDWGLTNISLLVPFCRTPEEGARVIELIKGIWSQGARPLAREQVKIYLMAETPSNVLLADEFLELFDGFSIGTNDLNQLVLGVDRSSPLFERIDSSSDEAIRELIRILIQLTGDRGKYCGMCGEASSTDPDFLRFVIKAGLPSLSVEPELFLPVLIQVARAEKET